MVDPAAQAAERFRVEPESVALHGAFARAQLVVTQSDKAGEFDASCPDVTHYATTYESSDPGVVTADAHGRLLAVANGQATITIRHKQTELRVPVQVDGVSPTPALDYMQDIVPIISKAGCNMGACHASQYGKGGFKLSVFGFDPRQDHLAIARDRRQRRIDPVVPANSLLLRKPTLDIAHGGGQRLEAGSIEYQTLKAWIAGGAPGPAKEPVKVTKLTLTPRRRVGSVGMRQQLRVEAEYSDGTRRDVTGLTKFDSMDEAVVKVNDNGLATTLDRGQAPVMARFEGQAEICEFVVPFSESFKLTGWRSQNFIDELAAAKFRELGVAPSPLCDDATFVRRAFLDAIGTLPTIEETRGFVQSNDPAKREKLIDRLLGLSGDSGAGPYNDYYAAFWTLKWSDLIRNNSNDLGEQGMWALHNWIKEAFRTNMPYDAFVRELVTAQGSIYKNGPANYFRVNRDSSQLTEATAQLFLGVRMECAKCHHHPFEKYSQDDYYGLAAFFSRVGLKSSQEFGLFGREQVVVVKSSGDVRQPRTGVLMKPTALDGKSLDHPIDRRIPLAKWLTSPENELFSKSVVNRYVGYLLGRGLVEPIDDMRSTNPPSNVALMDALAKHFVESGFDLKQLIRVIMVSRLYQLDSQPTADNASDRRFYSHFTVKRLAAEPLLDSVDQVTGDKTKFKSLPPGTRAIELPDAQYPNYFLNTFAKPRRASVCECERTPDENLTQALHTLNGDTLATKISAKNGRVAKLLAAKKPHEEIVEQLYLAALCRPPSTAELAASRKFLKTSASPREYYEDLLWALMNSKQFLFVR